MNGPNGLNYAQEERLRMLAGEAAEVIHMAMKTEQFGTESTHSDYNNVPNKQLLTKEIGDLLAVIELMVANYDIDPVELMEAKQSKNERMWQFMQCYHLNPMKKEESLLCFKS